MLITTAELGRELGIPEILVMRHPFPGPGIAIRILGEVTPEKVEIARHADDIYISEIRSAGLYERISQAYAAVDPSRAVGVMGDKRVYGYIIILRAVTTTDFMTSEACKCFKEVNNSNTEGIMSADSSQLSSLGHSFGRS